MTFMHVDKNFTIFWIPICLVISIPVRYLTKPSRWAVSPNLLLFLIAAIIGFVLTGIFGSDYEAIGNLDIELMISMYMPIFIISTIYRMDYFILMRCLPQVCIISIVGVAANLTVLVVLSGVSLYSGLTYGMVILHTLYLIPIQPSYVVLLFKELSKHKYLSTMLEAESVITCFPINGLFHIFIGNYYWNYTHIFLFHNITALIASIILGYISATFICMVYNEPLSALCISLGTTFVTYFVSKHRGVSVLAIIVYSFIIASKKPRFSSQVDISLYKFWGLLNYIAEVVSLMLCTIELTRHVWKTIEAQHIFGALILYIIVNLVRVTTFMLMGIVLNQMSFKMTVKSLLVLGWSNVKGSYSLMLALRLLQNKEDVPAAAKEFALQVFICVLLSQLFNSSMMHMVLHGLRLSKLSLIRKSNMQSLLKYLVEKRKSFINIMKLNRYLSDANWTLVRSETTIRNPYKLKVLVASGKHEHLDGFAWNTKSAICPECYKEVPFDISISELAQLTKDVQINIIKAKKESIIRQYENGTIDKNCVKVLLHLFEIMVETNMQDNIVDLDEFFKKKVSWEFIHWIVLKLNQQERIQPPRQPIRRLLFFVFMHISYDYIFFAFIILYIILILWYMFAKDMMLLYLISLLVHAVFIADLAIKICGYSRLTFMDGCKQYLVQGWNVFDLSTLVIGLLDLVSTLCGFFDKNGALDITLKILCLMRILKIFQVLQPFYPRMLEYTQYKMDFRMCFGYTMTSALVNCCDDLLSKIGQLVEVQSVREMYVQKIMEEKISLMKNLERVQRERPWVSITVKTKQVLRSILHRMEELLNELHLTGFLDETEYNYINKELYAKKKILKNMRFVQASPPLVIFNEVPWMLNDKSVVEYLYKHVQTVEWKTGHVICRPGEYLNGIYILVTGLLRLEYSPNISVLERLKKFGNIPIVDYLSTLHIDSTFEDNIMPGNSIGELSFLTGRPYDCTIIAETQSEAYLLTHDVIKQAIQLNSDIMQGLEARLWKCSLIHLVVAVLLESTLYQSFSQDQIKYKLERAFVPNIRCYKMFIITDMIDDVILIEGVVADFSTGEVYIAPTILPKTVQKIIFPRSEYGHLDSDQYGETKLMIVALNDVRDYDVMELEEEIAELVTLPSSRCLLNKVRETLHYRSLRQKFIDNTVVTKDSVITIGEYQYTKGNEIISLNKGSGNRDNSEELRDYTDVSTEGNFVADNREHTKK